MKGQIYIFGFILLALWGCERRVVDPGGVIESPYKLTGTVDGESYSVDLQPNHFKLAPTFQRSSFGVYQFIADFDNPSAQENLKICFNDDAREWTNKEVHPEEVLVAGAKQFQLAEVSLVHNVIEARADELDEVEYEWNFNENSLEESGAFIDLYEVSEGSELTIGLRIWEEGLLLDSLELNVEQMFSADQPIEYNFFYAEKVIQNDVVQELICHYDGDLNRVEQITWTAQRPDGSFVAAVQGNSASYSDLQLGVYNISMNVTLTNGITFKHARHIDNSNDGLEKVANFQFRTKVSEIEIEKMLSDVVILFEQNGQTYTSIGDVNGSAEPQIDFEIIAQGNMLSTNVGQHAQELDISFSCDLVNVDDPSDILEFRDFQGKIVVAFP